MKTQIIHLDRHDDTTSVNDKVDWSKSERVLLVWPHRTESLTHQLDLTLIQRHCLRSGVSLGIVTRKSKIKHLADKLLIPAFRTVREAQSIPWETDKSTIFSLPPKRNLNEIKNLKEKISNKEPRSLNQGQRGSLFVLGFLASLLLISIFIPIARIKIQPTSSVQEIEYTLNASTAFTSTNLNGDIPAEIILVQINDTETITPSGSIDIPQEPAIGKIELTNLTDREIYVPSNTIIRSQSEPPIRFTTLEPVTIPPEAGISVLTDIEAENPGSTSNLLENTLVIIEGDLGLSVSATNPNPTTGGSERTSAAPSINDYDLLQESLLDSIWNQALQQIDVDGNDFIVNTQPQEFKIIKQVFSPPEPAPASELSLNLDIEFEIIVVRQELLEKSANAILDTTQEGEWQIYPESIFVIPRSEPNFISPTQASWTVTAQRTVSDVTSNLTLIQLITGKTPKQAINILENELQLNKIPEITIIPSWWPILPWLPYQIEISQ